MKIDQFRGNFIGFNGISDIIQTPDGNFRAYHKGGIYQSWAIVIMYGYIINHNTVNYVALWLVAGCNTRVHKRIN